MLFEVARLLPSPELIDKKLSKILDLAFSILDIDRAATLMIDPETGEFGKPVAESRRSLPISPLARAQYYCVTPVGGADFAKNALPREHDHFVTL